MTHYTLNRQSIVFIMQMRLTFVSLQRKAVKGNRKSAVFLAPYTHILDESSVVLALVAFHEYK